MTASELRQLADDMLSMDDAVSMFFASAGIAPNKNIWHAMLILLTRQTAGQSACVADLFPQIWLSHRTRILYARHMALRELISFSAEEIGMESEVIMPLAKTIQIASILRQRVRN